MGKQVLISLCGINSGFPINSKQVDSRKEYDDPRDNPSILKLVAACKTRMYWCQNSDNNNKYLEKEPEIRKKNSAGTFFTLR